MANDDMAPRISAGDLLLYYRLANDWATGDVMVFEKDGEQYVGRIVAHGGDTVEVTDQAHPCGQRQHGAGKQHLLHHPEI